MDTSPTPSPQGDEISDISEAKWQNELQRSASRYHTIGAWVAIIFDPIFAITDFINIPDGWLQVFAIRVSVSLATLLALFLHKQGRISTYLFIAIPLFLISFQNAYTYSLIGPDNLLGHNLNYIALFLGAGLFILWPLRYSLVAIAASAIASFGFIFLNDSIDPSTFALNGGVLLLTATAFSILLIQARYRSRIREIKARLALADSLALTRSQKAEIEGQNAQLLQQAADLAAANSQIERINVQLTNQNENLEQIVDQRTADLRKTSSERDQIVYRLSHDFRTPIVNIRSLVTMLRRIPDEGAKKMLFGRIDGSIDRFDELVRDMENFPIYARQTLQVEAIIPQAEIQEVWLELQSKQMEGDRFIPGPGLEQPLSTDREKFRLVTRTILSNSLRYRKEGQAVEVRIDLDEKDGRWILHFRDNGSGIAPQVLPKVFDMFFRGDARGSGAGLGLYLAKGLMGQLQGGIRIESTAEMGTEVLCSFPKNISLAIASNA